MHPATGNRDGRLFTPATQSRDMRGLRKIWKISVVYHINKCVNRYEARQTFRYCLLAVVAGLLGYSKQHAALYEPAAEWVP